jgi:hypothetical protein
MRLVLIDQQIKGAVNAREATERSYFSKTADDHDAADGFAKCTRDIHVLCLEFAARSPRWIKHGSERREFLAADVQGGRTSRGLRPAASDRLEYLHGVESLQSRQEAALYSLPQFLE